MSDTKNTPGPWKTDADEFDVYATNPDVEGNIICEAPIGSKRSMANWVPNAKLIAAAPDLLEACTEMIKHLTETDFDFCGTKDEDLNRWKAAIKKATE